MPTNPFKRSPIWGSPVELYLFRTGSDANAVIAYNDSDRAVVYNGVTYQPLPIKRGKITSQGSLDKSEMKIEVPPDSAIAEIFRAFAPTQPVALTIFAGEMSDDRGVSHAAIWVGRVLQSVRDIDGGKDTATLLCKPWSSSLKRLGLRRTYQPTCPHVLYGERCGADKAAATATHVVRAVQPTFIGLNVGWEGAEPFARFRNGLVSWAGTNGPEHRMILNCGANGLAVTHTLGGLAPDDIVEVSFGCNRTMGNCRNVHNNIKNFGGFPWLPLENPVNKSQE